MAWINLADLENQIQQALPISIHKIKALVEDSKLTLTIEAPPDEAIQGDQIKQIVHDCCLERVPDSIKHILIHVQTGSGELKLNLPWEFDDDPFDLTGAVETLETQGVIRRDQLKFNLDPQISDSVTPESPRTTPPIAWERLTRDPNWIERLLNVRAGEGRILLVLGFVLFLNALAQKLSEIASISGFLTEVGPTQILGVWLIDGILLILAASLQSLVVDKFKRIQLMKGVGLAVIGAFLVLLAMDQLGAPTWARFGWFYLLSQQQFTFVPTVFWILCNDVLEIPQTRRLFPKITVLGILGNLLGIALAGLAPTVLATLGLESVAIIITNITIYLLIYVLIDRGLTRVSVRSLAQDVAGVQETFWEGWNFIREVPAFGYLTVSLLAVFICDQLIEFRFLFLSQQTFQDLDTYQQFFSLFTLGRFLGYLGIQVWLAEPILSTFGLQGAFLISPISALIGTGINLGINNLGGAVAGLAVQKLPLYSIDETARKNILGMVPEERRGRVSLFLDNYLTAGGTILASALALALLWISHVAFDDAPIQYWVLFIAALAAPISIWAIMKFRKVYEGSMLNWRLRRRQKGSQVLDDLDF